MGKKRPGRPRGAGNRGESLPEVLIAIPIAAMAVLLLLYALSVLTPPERAARPEGQGTVHARFELGDSEYGIDIGVWYDEEGYVYAYE